jgi:hypothetical protein
MRQVTLARREAVSHADIQQIGRSGDDAAGAASAGQSGDPADGVGRLVCVDRPPEKTSRFRPGPLGVGRISVGPFLQTALGTQAKEILAGWG